MPGCPEFFKAKGCKLGSHKCMELFGKRGGGAFNI